MRGISIKAVLLATLAVFGIDFASSLMLTAVFGGSLLSLTGAQLEAALAALNRDPAYLSSALVLGTGSTVVGGWLAARLAGAVPYFNALAFGLLGVVLGAWLSEGLPAWFRALGLGITIPAALLGAHLSRRAK